MRSFCSHCGTPLFYERPRSPHMVNISRALFASRTGRQPLYHIAIEELHEWAYTGEPLVPLKGYPGVVWQRWKKNTRAGQCLCGKVAFEIDVPARWAWHDHSAASRRAHGAAYATYVGSWRKRFRITKGKTLVARYEDGATKTVRSFCSNCGTPLFYERPRSPHMVNISRALFESRTGRQPLYHIAIEELQEWAYTGEPLVPLKGFPGVVWQRSKKKRRAAGEDPFELGREDA